MAKIGKMALRAGWMQSGRRKASGRDEMLLMEPAGWLQTASHAPSVIGYGRGFRLSRQFHVHHHDIHSAENRASRIEAGVSLTSVRLLNDKVIPNFASQYMYSFRACLVNLTKTQHFLQTPNTFALNAEAAQHAITMSGGTMIDLE